MNTLYVVNTMSSARPASRALGLKLVRQERGTQYYVSKRQSVKSPSIIMTIARREPLDVCVRTAHLLGVDLGGSVWGTDFTASVAPELPGPQQRFVLCLCENEHIAAPAIGIRVQGSPLDRPYYPDVLAASNLPELTIESPEAAGFASAVSRLCGPHEVLIGLVPSGGSPAAQRDAVADFATLAESVMRKRPFTFHLDRFESETLQSCADRLRLSAAEQSLLEKAARAARIRGADSETVIHLISEADNARTVITELERIHAE